MRRADCDALVRDQANTLHQVPGQDRGVGGGVLMRRLLVLVMACGCVTEVVDGDGHPVARFDAADPDCPLLRDHILVTMAQLRRAGRW